MPVTLDRTPLIPALEMYTMCNNEEIYRLNKRLEGLQERVYELEDELREAREELRVMAAELEEARAEKAQPKKQPKHKRLSCGVEYQDVEMGGGLTVRRGDGVELSYAIEVDGVVVESLGSMHVQIGRRKGDGVELSYAIEVDGVVLESLGSMHVQIGRRKLVKGWDMAVEGVKVLFSRPTWVLAKRCGP
ncbi:hypothetical protein HDU89_006308 [Geranomyces variabilis]|nr:hypothetical protein HDU89_006308 [Geranomyces variabilis]